MIPIKTWPAGQLTVTVGATIHVGTPFVIPVRILPTGQVTFTPGVGSSQRTLLFTHFKTCPLGHVVAPEALSGGNNWPACAGAPQRSDRRIKAEITICIISSLNGRNGLRLVFITGVPDAAIATVGAVGCLYGVIARWA